MKLADRIILSLMRELRSRNHEFVLPNFYVGDWECDVYSILKSGYTEEYEIKITVADYKKDFEKAAHTYDWRTQARSLSNKHMLIKQGKRANRFYFVVPEGLIKPEDVPEYAGLYYARPNKEFSRGRSVWLQQVKAPRLLHKNKIDLTGNKPIHQIAQRCYSRYIDLFWRWDGEHPFPEEGKNN